MENKTNKYEKHEQCEVQKYGHQTGTCMYWCVLDEGRKGGVEREREMEKDKMYHAQYG